LGVQCHGRITRPTLGGIRGVQGFAETVFFFHTFLFNGVKPRTASLANVRPAVRECTVLQVGQDGAFVPVDLVNFEIKPAGANLAVQGSEFSVVRGEAPFSDGVESECHAQVGVGLVVKTPINVLRLALSIFGVKASSAYPAFALGVFFETPRQSHAF
jgi:hypothetical protein